MQQLSGNTGIPFRGKKGQRIAIVSTWPPIKDRSLILCVNGTPTVWRENENSPKVLQHQVISHSAVRRTKHWWQADLTNTGINPRILIPIARPTKVFMFFFSTKQLSLFTKRCWLVCKHFSKTRSHFLVLPFKNIPHAARWTSQMSLLPLNRKWWYFFLFSFLPIPWMCLILTFAHNAVLLHFKGKLCNSFSS